MDEPVIAVDQPSDEPLKDWETPELIIESVERATQGGVIGDFEADDAFYS